MNDMNLDLDSIDLSNFDSADIGTDKYGNGWRNVIINDVTIEPNTNAKHAGSGAMNMWLYLSTTANDVYKNKKDCVFLKPTDPEQMAMAIEKLSRILSNHFKKSTKEVSEMFKNKQITMAQATKLLINLEYKVYCENKPSPDGKMWLTPTTILEYGKQEYTPNAKKASAPVAAKPVVTDDVPF